MRMSLFPDWVFDNPDTEGVKYAGSKLNMLPHILKLTQKINPKSVFDGFAGTTRVSQAFSQMGYRVVSNDKAVWSKTFGMCYLKNRNPRGYYQEMIDHLNALNGTDGWYTENYGGYPNGGTSSRHDGLKRPWQVQNTRKLDAIREEIDRMNLAEVEKSVVLTSLILALDKVDSTLGHYASYLENWSPRSYNVLKLLVPNLIKTELEHEIHNDDIFNVLDRVQTDLAYFDPPYGSNNEKMPPSRIRYAAYYHLWTTICLNDHPKLFGKAKRRVDSSDILAGSVFEDFRTGASGRFVVVEAIERLLKNTNAKHIILSYSSGGRATATELYEILSQSGKMLEFVKVDHRRHVMSGMTWTNEWVHNNDKQNQEYLFLMEK